MVLNYCPSFPYLFGTVKERQIALSFPLDKKNASWQLSLKKSEWLWWLPWKCVGPFDLLL